MTTTPRVTFETEPCSRCGGSGEFSFNLMTGTKCFKCGTASGVVGSGLQLSRRGRAARKAYDAVMARMNRTYGDVVVGDRVKLAVGITPKWRTVLEVNESHAYTNGTKAVEIECTGGSFIAPATNEVMVWSADIHRDACARVANMAGASVTGLVADSPVTTDELVKLINDLPTTYEVLSAPKSSTRRSHADCGHERTPKARAACRRNS